MSAIHHLIAVRENVRFARGALTAHKLRSSLTVLGIVIGVVALFVATRARKPSGS